MLFTTGYRCPLVSASERTLLMHDPLTTMDPRSSNPHAVATGWEETRHVLETAMGYGLCASTSSRGQYTITWPGAAALAQGDDSVYATCPPAFRNRRQYPRPTPMVYRLAEVLF